MRILNRLRAYKKWKSPYQPLIEIMLSKHRLQGNLRVFQNQHPGVDVAPVLKSNAYGHGIIEVAQMLKDSAVPFFIVDSLYEAQVLRCHGIKTPLLIIGYTSVQNIRQNRLPNISFAITSLTELERLPSVLDRACTMHIKIDTGMHRQGIMIEEISAAIELVKRNRHLFLEGICSHLADADSQDTGFTHQQIRVWKDVVQHIRQVIPSIRYIHLSNSAGAEICSADVANVMRVGLSLYGIHPTKNSRMNLQPVLEMKTILSSFKNMMPGDRVGYNMTYTASRPMKIATIPVGYFEGVDRRLSNQGVVMVKGIPCPIIGRVSMNITSIDVSQISDLAVGDPVTVIGNDPDAPNSVEHMARLCQTIPYEILVHIPQHLRRTVEE